MKFQSMPAFEKHLNEAFPDHLSHAYMVTSPSDFERKRMIEMIGSTLRRKDQMEESVLDASSCSIESILDHLNSYSLFGGHSLVVVDRIDKLKKSACEALARYLASPSGTTYLILGGSTLKGLTDLYQKGKKELVILDLSEEKPWERKARLRQWLVKEASSAKKTLAPALIDYLMEKIEPDMQNLHQELEKLIVFTGEKRIIELQDALRICSPGQSSSSWRIADSLVWEEKGNSYESIQDLSFLLPLIGAIRYQLHLGHQISFFIRHGETVQEVASHFPNLKRPSLEKYTALVSQRGEPFFKKGLILLFELELSLKNGMLDPSFAWDLFKAKMDGLKSRGGQHV
ncbi:MAG TPA: hypothetical protein VLG49_01580 [Rhabdochlamydiaceae bacterium]|nr:hypothetical protein [Rhabdochlamydiaceae bacterium]